MKALYWIISSAITLTGIGVMTAGVQRAEQERNTDTEEKTFSFETADSLCVNANRSNVQIVTDAQAEAISIVMKNVPDHADAKEDHGEIVISDQDTKILRFFSFDFGSWFLSPKQEIIVTVPEETEFTKLELNLGSGSSSAQKIDAQTIEINHASGKLALSGCTAAKDMTVYSGSGEISMERCTVGGNTELELGSGNTSLTNCETKTFLLDSGSGSITVQDFAVADSMEVSIASGSLKGSGVKVGGASELELASGEMELTGFTPGAQTEVDLSSGSMRFTLTGREEDYGFNCQNSSGSTTIGERSGSDLIVKGGDKQINVEGASGTVKFLFEK